jgi:hypothetical protein
MFDSRSATDQASQRVTRRVFLFTAIAAAGGMALLTLRRPHQAFADNTVPNSAEPVVVVLFSDDGKRLRKVTMPKVAKSAGDWQKQLSPNTYDIARLADTEVATLAAYGISTSAASIDASAAILRCSARTRSSSPALAGQASGRPSPKKTSWNSATPASVCCALP